MPILTSTHQMAFHRFYFGLTGLFFVSVWADRMFTKYAKDWYRSLLKNLILKHCCIILKTIDL